MSFDIKVDEEDARIMGQFKMLAEECDTFEKAIGERIEYLFNAHVEVDGKKKDTAFQQLLQLFSIGYKCGWNDYKSIIDERKA